MENRLFCAEMTGQGELRHGVLKKWFLFFYNLFLGLLV